MNSKAKTTQDFEKMQRFEWVCRELARFNKSSKDMNLDELQIFSNLAREFDQSIGDERLHDEFSKIRDRFSFSQAQLHEIETIVAQKTDSATTISRVGGAEIGIIEHNLQQARNQQANDEAILTYLNDPLVIDANRRFKNGDFSAFDNINRPINQVFDAEHLLTQRGLEFFMSRGGDFNLSIRTPEGPKNIVEIFEEGFKSLEQEYRSCLNLANEKKQLYAVAVVNLVKGKMTLEELEQVVPEKEYKEILGLYRNVLKDRNLLDSIRTASVKRTGLGVQSSASQTGQNYFCLTGNDLLVVSGSSQEFSVQEFGQIMNRVSGALGQEAQNFSKKVKGYLGLGNAITESGQVKDSTVNETVKELTSKIVNLSDGLNNLNIRASASYGQYPQSQDSQLNRYLEKAQEKPQEQGQTSSSLVHCGQNITERVLEEFNGTQINVDNR